MKKSQGFTLIEMILYIGLIMIMLVSIVSFSLEMINSGAKSNTEQEVYSSARYASERIISTIRNAKSINIASSSFGTNLVASSGAALSLGESASSSNPTTFSIVSGILTITQGTSGAVTLNPSSTQVTSLVFSNYSTGTYSNIGFTLIMTGSTTTTVNAYQASSTIEASAELRSD